MADVAGVTAHNGNIDSLYPTSHDGIAHLAQIYIGMYVVPIIYIYIILFILVSNVKQMMLNRQSHLIVHTCYNYS
jgi:hypothetical protein